ncbi:ribonuclease H-like domain-containing protein [Alicyclobacillus fastidiosus]|uniref:Ribonuclease H-like domain-containing protein n=1 Tax=Alicyclobacillus fastidiosus TaxID=392011 RepID=A0ABY6ZFF2_9BACL|nr:ribonuclease H-like domain-containing protein [Alicyclobacillus fastidiosus]WAH41582.1 ribonuclease H-like domain-containing protein [Alicyclobacillus fastidiosus]
MARSLLDKLRALEQSVKQSQEPVAVPETGQSPDADTTPVSGDDAFERAGFERLETPYGHCWRRKTTFDVFTRHGHHLFADVLEVDYTGLAHLVGGPVDPSWMRYYDVETNGLGTGAGTFPFLHTIGYFEHDELCFMQYFVDDHGAEAAVLHAIAEHHLPEGVTVVTFNGKSFDWPLYQNRRVLHHLDRLERGQLDLLHPSRRLWKSQLASVKLVELERGVLGVHRLDDLPGSQAPERYFQFLESRDVQVVEPVISHNLMDVCSLVVLQVEIARLLNGEESNLPSPTHLALASWYDAWHEVQAAALSYERAAQAQDASWRAHWLYSLFLKRQHNEDEACHLWAQMATDYPERVEPLVELAKCFEHRRRDLARAEEVVEEALRRLVKPSSGHHLAIPHRVEARPVLTADVAQSPIERALSHRLLRIQRKRARVHGQESDATPVTLADKPSLV